MDKALRNLFIAFLLGTLLPGFGLFLAILLWSLLDEKDSVKPKSNQ